MVKCKEKFCFLLIGRIYKVEIGHPLQPTRVSALKYYSQLCLGNDHSCT